MREAVLEAEVEPLCPVFGTCGGCSYQHVRYETELQAKQHLLEETLREKLDIAEGVIRAIVPSPNPYHSRSRLDLTTRRIKTGEVLLGFMPPRSKRIVTIDSCSIAREEIAAFIPELKKRAEEKLTGKYKNGNLVVKTGDDGRVRWGGIGRRSLRMEPEDYLWTEVRGRRVYYSLDTFFQANLSILGALMDRIEEMLPTDAGRLFLDLYSGVGLFGFCLADRFEKVIMIEENPASVKVAQHNAAYHKMTNITILEGRVEERLPHILSLEGEINPVGMIDPPRKGLSESAMQMLVEARKLKYLFYLSCHPESLTRDLEKLTLAGWKVREIIPFDFFPKTSHLETLVLMERGDS